MEVLSRSSFVELAKSAAEALVGCRKLRHDELMVLATYCVLVEGGCNFLEVV